MNKFAKALLLALVIATPVATSEIAAQATPATRHYQAEASHKAMKKKNRHAKYCKAHPSAKVCQRR